jgi:glutathione S-transferase
MDEIGKHERAGATVTQSAPPRIRSRAHFLEWIQWFAEEVMPAFRG